MSIYAIVAIIVLGACVAMVTTASVERAEKTTSTFCARKTGRSFKVSGWCRPTSLDSWRVASACIAAKQSRTATIPVSPCAHLFIIFIFIFFFLGYPQRWHGIALACLVVVLYTLVFACLFLAVEPDVFGSFGEALYFAVITATAIGFGDFSPRPFA